MNLSRRLAAELFGTFWLVLGGCGNAVLAANFAGPAHGLGIGFVGVSLAFGLTVLTMAHAIGHISGCHLNPAVSVGLTVAGRFPARDVVPYINAPCSARTCCPSSLRAIRTSIWSRAVSRVTVMATARPAITRCRLRSSAKR
jgi:glycerol uptake facilitator-like aquaporin